MSEKNQNKGLKRRKFIQTGIAGLAGVHLATGAAVNVLLSAGCTTTKEKTVRGACYHDCPDTCSWEVKTDGSQILNFGADPDHPFTQGVLCEKMDRFPWDVTFHQDRILTPMKRVGKKGEGTFVPVSWEEALSAVAAELKKILSEYSGEAVLPYVYAGTQGLIQQNLMGSRFFALLGASSLEGTICGATAAAAVQSVYGQTTGILPEDIQHSKYIILWGVNTIQSNPHLWPFIEKARASGAKLVVIDPYRSATAAKADWHLRPKPGTDTALALGMMNIMMRNNWIDQDYITQYTEGFDALKEHVGAYSPDVVSALTGIAEDEITKLTQEYSNTSPAVIRILIGIEHQANGGSACRAIAMLPCLTGAWRLRGGGLLHFTYELFGEALNWEQWERADQLRERAPRKVNMIKIGQSLMDDSLDPPIKSLFIYNANPAVTAPNQNLVLRGLEREDLFTVVLEHFMTDTARYADYIFPATTQLEHWDLMDSWGQVYLHLNEPAISPLGESKSNNDFFRLLAQKMGFPENVFRTSDQEIIKSALKSDHPYLGGITFNQLKKKGWIRLNLPEPWMPFEKGGFPTPSGKSLLLNESLVEEGIDVLPTYLPVEYGKQEAEKYPILLLTLKTRKVFLNSSHANVQHLIDKSDGFTLDIHPADAEARGITDQSRVRIFNDRGSLEVVARLSTKTGKGVACLPQGFWSSLLEGKASANVLTGDRWTDMARGGALQENRVQIEKV